MRKNETMTPRTGKDDVLAPLSLRIKEVIGNESIRRFAAKCDISDSVLRRYIAGKSEPGVVTIVKIAKVGGVSVEWLVTGDACPAEHVVRENTPVYATNYEDKLTRVGLILRESRQLYESAVKLSGYEPDRAVGEHIKTIIFDSFAQDRVDIKTITHLLTSLKDSIDKKE